MSAPKSHPYPAMATRVISVHGSDREMGRQHAEQLGDAVKVGMTRFYLDLWRRLTGTRPEHPISALAFGGAVWAIERFLVNRLARQIPPGMKERLQGIADVTGMDITDLLTTAVLPDLMPLLQTYLVRMQPARFLDAAEAPRFGCSSFLASGERFLVGRNLDFPGVAYWDRYPVIQLTAPTGTLKYIAFASAGIPLAGITGVNEAQLSVQLHQHYCRAASLTGRLPFFIAEEMLAKARTVNEALEILQGGRVASSWAFIVADGKTREGFIAETQPGKIGVRRFQRGSEPMAHSNFYQSAECRPAEYATSERMNWDNYWRKTRLEELVRVAGEGLTPATAVQCLSDHFDGYWGEEKPINRTVSQLYNIQSLVLDPESMRVYFAEGDAPVHLGRFAEYDLGDIFAGGKGVTGRSLPAYQFRDPGIREAKQQYVISFVEGFEGRWEPAIEAMKKSLAASYTAEGAMVLALLKLKLGAHQEAHDDLATAKRWIEEKLASGPRRETPPPEYFEVCLFLARSCDLLGLKEEAAGTYAAIAAHPGARDANLKSIAKRARPYGRKDVARIVAPYSSYLPFT